MSEAKIDIWKKFYKMCSPVSRPKKYLQNSLQYR